MNRQRNRIVRVLAVLLSAIMCSLVAFNSFAENTETPEEKVSKYEKMDINYLTGQGQEPEELSVSAVTTYQEKAWYEYVTYSEHAVCSYRLSDDARLLFYDPYTYSNSMIMDVNFDATTTEFDTMSEYSVSSFSSKTIENAANSTYTNSSSTQTSGRDITYSNVDNEGELVTTYNHKITDYTTGQKSDVTDYEYKAYDTYEDSFETTDTIGATIGAKTGIEGIKEILEATVEDTVSTSISEKESFGIQWETDKVTNKTIYSSDYSTSTEYSGDDTVEYNSNSVTDGWTQLAARVTKSLGSSSSTSTSWAETEGTTITRTYAATHFASDGVTPLPWAIVHYSVKMPLKCCYQYKVNGEWLTITTVYCLLTTVHGTCRAWMQNSQVYYEDWGNGEPVTATDFWSQFMTKSQLINAYNNKLYPVGGEN